MNEKEVKQCSNCKHCKDMCISMYCKVKAIVLDELVTNCDLFESK